MNEMLVTVKAEERIFMIKNVALSFIEAENFKVENIHIFEIMNAEWVPENIILRRPKISKVAKMAANCFLKHENPFWYDPNTRMLDRINVMKLKYVDQRFGLGYKPKKDDYKRVTKINRGARMTKIEGREPEEEEFIILPLQTTFPKLTQVIRSDNEILKITNLYTSALECEDRAYWGGKSQSGGWDAVVIVYTHRRWNPCKILCEEFG